MFSMYKQHDYEPWKLKPTFGQRLFRLGFPILVVASLWRGWFRAWLDWEFDTWSAAWTSLDGTFAWTRSLFSEGVGIIGLFFIIAVCVGVVSIGSGRTIGNYRRPWY